MADSSSWISVSSSGGQEWLMPSDIDSEELEAGEEIQQKMDGLAEAAPAEATEEGETSVEPQKAYAAEPPGKKEADAVEPLEKSKGEKMAEQEEAGLADPPEENEWQITTEPQEVGPAPATNEGDSTAELEVHNEMTDEPVWLSTASMSLRSNQTSESPQQTAATTTPGAWRAAAIAVARATAASVADAAAMADAAKTRAKAAIQEASAGVSAVGARVSVRMALWHLSAPSRHLHLPSQRLVNLLLVLAIAVLCATCTGDNSGRTRSRDATESVREIDRLSAVLAATERLSAEREEALMRSDAALSDARELAESMRQEVQSMRDEVQRTLDLRAVELQSARDALVEARAEVAHAKQAHAEQVRQKNVAVAEARKERIAERRSWKWRVDELSEKLNSSCGGKTRGTQPIPTCAMQLRKQATEHDQQAAALEAKLHKQAIELAKVREHARTLSDTIAEQDKRVSQLQTQLAQARRQRDRAGPTGVPPDQAQDGHRHRGHNEHRHHQHPKCPGSWWTSDWVNNQLLRDGKRLIKHTMGLGELGDWGSVLGGCWL